LARVSWMHWRLLYCLNLYESGLELRDEIWGPSFASCWLFASAAHFQGPRTKHGVYTLGCFFCLNLSGLCVDLREAFESPLSRAAGWLCSLFPRSTHETFATKLYSSLSNNKRFSKPKRSQTDFAVEHYAGEVVYQTDLFLEKNKDYVVAEHQALLGSSGDEFVKQLFPPPADEGNSKSGYKFSSIGTRFKVCDRLDRWRRESSAESVSWRSYTSVTR
jgi:hypothetical protein